jgi:hypothetical protein
MIAAWRDCVAPLSFLMVIAAADKCTVCPIPPSAVGEALVNKAFSLVGLPYFPFFIFSDSALLDG